MSETCTKVGFWAALCGCCCGTAVFKQLSCHSWRRTLFHFFLLAFLVALAISAASTFRAQKDVNEFTALFTEEFGGIACGPDGIAPAANARQPRTIALPNDGRLVYLPNWQQGVNYSPDDLKVFRYIIFWTPERQVFAVNQGEEFGWGIITRKGLTDLTQQMFSTSEFSGWLKTPDNSVGNWKNMPVFTQPFTFWAKFLLCGLAITLLFGYFIGIVWLTLLYIGIFALMFRLTGGAKKLASMTFSQFCKVGVYAAFPAMLVAGCFPLLELPLLSFNTVYMIGLVIYWLIVVNRNEMDFRQNQGDN